MTLIVENGTGVANANSYVSLSDITTFASARGLTVTSDATKKEQYALLAMDYLESLNFQGSKVSATQALQWPRSDVVIDGNEYAEDGVPTDLKNAQCQLVVELTASGSLYPLPVTSAKGSVIERTIGPLTTKYSPDKGMVNPVSPIIFPAVRLFLAKLLSGNNACRTIRV